MVVTLYVASLNGILPVALMLRACATGAPLHGYTARFGGDGALRRAPWTTLRALRQKLRIMRVALSCTRLIAL